MAEGDFDIRAIISANTSNFEKGMKSAQTSLGNVSKSIEGVQNLLKSAFSVIGITASVGAVVNFGKKAVASADEANKRFNVLANTIRATGASTWTSVEELDKMAKAYAQSTDYSVSEVEKMQSVLLGFKNISGETFEQASDAIMDMATVMGMDLTSAVQTVGKALDDPIKGLDSLRRQGFAFTDEQKAELTQLVKNGDQLKAQQIILNELATTYGGASKAGQSAFARLQHTMDEFRENIGNKLMPVVNTVMGNMSESMTRVMNIINSADFDRFVAIIVNIGNKIKGVLETISGEIKKTFDSIKATVNSVDFGPFMKIMDTLVGLVQKTFSEIKRNIQNSFATFAELKERMGIFTDALDLDKIVNIINTVVDVFVFLRDEIQSVGDEIRKLIFDNIVKIWNYIKQVFDNSNDALMNSESSIKSWGDFFYETFNNVFKIFQDLFGSIKAILTGDWEVAWEYAKLAMMRVADNILNLMSTIANAFPNLINGMIDALNKLVIEINKVREFFGQDPLGLINTFKSVDLSESSGLNAKIAQAEKKIEELTGKSADISIKQLKGISKVASGFTKKFIEDITDTTNVVGANADQRKKYEVSSYQGIGDEAESTYKKISEWDLKLLNQQLDGLKDYSKKYHDISLQIIEAERQKALEADTTGADTEKINKYYNKEIEKENKRHIKAILVEVGSVVGKIAGVMKNIVSTVISGLKGIFGAFRNIGTKLFDFNIDDALDNLLVFEDKILTFFVETLPRLPQFFASAFQSIVVLLETIFDSVDFEGLMGSLVNSVIKILKDIPKLITKAIPKMIRAVGTLFKEFRKLLPELIKAFEEITQELFKVLPDFVQVELPAFLNSIASFIPTLLRAGSEFVKILVSALPGIIQAIIDAFILLLQNPKEIADLAVAIIKGFVEVIMVVVRNIAPLLKALLPAIATIIIEIFKALPELLWSLTKELGKAILEIGKWVVNMIIDGINTMLDGISSVWTWIPGTKGIPHIPHFANGTNDAPKGLALVGEYGPELVRFNGGEQVLNASNTQKALAGNNNSGNTWNVTFNNTKDTSAYTMMKQLKQYNRQMAINGII